MIARLRYSVQKLLQTLGLLSFLVLDVRAVPNAAPQNIVEFRLFYPLVSFTDPSYRINQHHYLGFGCTYEYFFGHWGVHFEPSVFGIPVKKNGDKEKLFNAGLAAGFALRFLPRTYLDPVVHLIGAVELFDTATQPARFDFPIGARFNINLYKISTVYMDNDLALTLSTAIRHSFDAYPILNSNIYEFGLALRGSF